MALSQVARMMKRKKHTRANYYILQHAPLESVHKVGFGGPVSPAAEGEDELCLFFSEECFVCVSTSCSSDIVDEEEEEGGYGDGFVNDFDEFVVGVGTEESVGEEGDDGVDCGHIQDPYNLFLLCWFGVVTGMHNYGYTRDKKSDGSTSTSYSPSDSVVIPVQRAVRPEGGLVYNPGVIGHTFGNHSGGEEEKRERGQPVTKSGYK
jgi:hypothetical protein